ncbi:MAG: hypothetical protein M1835_005220 [Candelina submexicana]|nr:MAG: hypothetical protein M1835_005220 [Candelina submexicana]
MSIPNEALQKLVQEIETRAVLAQQQISVVKTQIAARQRDIRILQLTAGELGTVPQDTKVYEGVGKMYVRTSVVRYVLDRGYNLGSRFVSSPIDEVNKRLATETSEMKADISNLDKKLHYLETTHKNSRDHIEQIIGSGGRS